MTEITAVVDWPRFMTGDTNDDQSTLLYARFDPTEDQGRFTVVAVEGADAGSRWVLDGTRPSRTLVGASPACDVRLSDRTVSRRHIALEVEGERLRITDLSSTNETIVDGITVMDGYLRGGERIQLGATVLAVERGPSQTAEISRAKSFGPVIGASSEMRRLYPLCERLAQADIPVVIEGETGTGKEVMARALHECSPRADGPFIVFDCTTVPSNLVESELFGHERGAFTGATRERAGLFEEAHGGTLLIDEIGDLDVGMQAKLLRVIDTAEFRRVGSNAYRRTRVRIVAATRRDLDREIQAGRFRDDLYHRLAVGRVELPPLRKRKGDVWVLSRHFAKELGHRPDAIPTSLLSRWDRDPWPGNVRELKNAVARHLVLGELALMPETAAPREVQPQSGGEMDRIIALGLPLQEAREQLNREFSLRYLRKALADADGNVTHAARASGVSRRYLQALKAKLGQ